MLLEVLQSKGFLHIQKTVCTILHQVKISTLKKHLTDSESSELTNISTSVT